MHQYIVNLTHCKIKWKLSLLIIIFITRWKICLLPISLILLMCTYFLIGARICSLTSNLLMCTYFWIGARICSLTSKTCKCKVLISTCHQRLVVIYGTKRYLRHDSQLFFHWIYRPYHVQSWTKGFDFLVRMGST